MAVEFVSDGQHLFWRGMWQKKKTEVFVPVVVACAAGKECRIVNEALKVDRWVDLYDLFLEDPEGNKAGSAKEPHP